MNTSQETKQLNLTKTRIWKLGNHRLINGDSRSIETIKKLFSDGTKVSAVICDIPYGISYVESKADIASIKVKKDIENDDITNEGEYIKFNEEWLRNIIPYLTNKNSIYIFNCDKMIFALRQAMLNVGIKFTQLLIWIKNQAVIGRMDYLPQHELIAYGWYKRHAFVRAKDKSVLFYPRPNKSKYHCTTKPHALMKDLILNSTRVDEVVFDGFLGSGSTLLSCQETGRICYGCEIDLDYCKTIIDRFEKRYNIKVIEI